MFEQRVCCIKVVLPKKEMPALSVTIQRRKVARNGATEHRSLAIEVVMDQHGSQYLLLVIGGRTVGVAKETVEKKNSSAESILYLGKLSNSLRASKKETAGEGRRGAHRPASCPAGVRRACR